VEEQVNDPLKKIYQVWKKKGGFNGRNSKPYKGRYSRGKKESCSLLRVKKSRHFYLVCLEANKNRGPISRKMYRKSSYIYGRI